MQSKLYLLLCLLLCIAIHSRAQHNSNSPSLSGAAGLTSNGISLIPSFSLEKPAALFNMSLEKGRFSFDPEITFSLEGKPWYMLFWFRYQLVNTPRFRMKAGTHLGLNFVSRALPNHTVPSRAILTERYLVGELSPAYSLTENISVGLYYLLARGFDIGTNKTMKFISINSTISNISLTEKLSMRVTPQLYYLYLYGEDGFYVTSAFTLSRKDFPLSLSSTVNKVIDTKITVGKDFLWNLTLTYSFGKGRIASSFPEPSIPPTSPTGEGN